MPSDCVLILLVSIWWFALTFMDWCWNFLNSNSFMTIGSSIDGHFYQKKKVLMATLFFFFWKKKLLSHKFLIFIFKLIFKWYGLMKLKEYYCLSVGLACGTCIYYYSCLLFFICIGIFIFENGRALFLHNTA